MEWYLTFLYLKNRIFIFQTQKISYSMLKLRICKDLISKDTDWRSQMHSLIFYDTLSSEKAVAHNPKQFFYHIYFISSIFNLLIYFNQIISDCINKNVFTSFLSAHSFFQMDGVLISHEHAETAKKFGTTQILHCVQGPKEIMMTK